MKQGSLNLLTEQMTVEYLHLAKKCYIKFRSQLNTDLTISFALNFDTGIIFLYEIDFYNVESTSKFSWLLIFSAEEFEAMKSNEKIAVKCEKMFSSSAYQREKMYNACKFYDLLS